MVGRITGIADSPHWNPKGTQHSTSMIIPEKILDHVETMDGWIRDHFASFVSDCTNEEDPSEEEYDTPQDLVFAFCEHLRGLIRYCHSGDDEQGMDLQKEVEALENLADKDQFDQPT